MACYNNRKLRLISNLLWGPKENLNDLQIFLEDISYLWHTIGIGSDDLINLNKTLDGDKDLNSPRELTAETERELTLIEEKLQKTHVDCVDLNLNCILVILPSRHFPTEILMQKEYIILKWIFLPHKPKTETSSISRNRPSRDFSAFCY